MTPHQKGVLISDILTQLKFTADQNKKKFDIGSMFLSLCFKTEKELVHIAKQAGVL